VLFIAIFSISAGAFVADVTVTLFFILLLNRLAAESLSLPDPRSPKLEAETSTLG